MSKKAKKGMATSLVIVVTAVVLLVVALVLLTIFGLGITQVTSIAEAKNTCGMTHASACSSFGTMPVDWEVQTKLVRDANGVAIRQSCAELFTGKTCRCKPEGATYKAVCE